MIFGLCGLQGSGKDTVANILINDHNFIKISFASATKDVVSILFGWDRKMLEGDTQESRKEREIVDEWWSNKLNIKDFSPRKALQIIGTDVLRDGFHSDIWISIVEKKIIENLNNGKNIVISDCRFSNEMEMIKKYGGKVVCIKRNTPDWFDEYKSGKDLEIIKNIHPSETSWIRCEFDKEINNMFSIDVLKKDIEDILTLYQNL